MHARTRAEACPGSVGVGCAGAEDAETLTASTGLCPPYCERDRLVREIATTSYPQVGTT